MAFTISVKCLATNLIVAPLQVMSLSLNDCLQDFLFKDLFFIKTSSNAVYLGALVFVWILLVFSSAYWIIGLLYFWLEKNSAIFSLLFIPFLPRVTNHTYISYFMSHVISYELFPSSSFFPLFTSDWIFSTGTSFAVCIQLWNLYI